MACLVMSCLGASVCPIAAQPAEDAPAHAHAREERRPPTLRDQVGITAAERLFGGKTPIGRDVKLAHVEGSDGEYAPRPDGSMRAVAFVLKSGPSKTSGHAVTTAAKIYGSNGIAPGVKLVNVYSVPSWLGDHYLHVGQPQQPEDEHIDVSTHSWIAPDHAAAVFVLRRVDWVAEAREEVIVAGVNNGRGDVPALLGSGYNVIAVGSTNNNSSVGPTKHAGEGRSKPDLIAPGGLTSYTTPVVAGLAARLVEAAQTWPEEADREPARRSETIRALLMAGATKPEGWARHDARPFDDAMGAGVPHLAHSLLMLKGGRPDDGKLTSRFGWDSLSLRPGESAVYTFDVSDAVDEASFILTWNRRIAGETLTIHDTGQEAWNDLPRMADFDLQLFRVTGEGDQAEEAQASTSRLDNVEHIFMKPLEPGSYRLEVTRREDGHDESWEASLAWRLGGVK